MKSSCKIYSFLRAVRGNWRNAIFVSCDCGNCMCGRTTPCSGFLLAVDECGQVIPTGATQRSGYCEYPEYRFRADRLRELDPEGYAEYLSLQEGRRSA